MKSKIQKFIKTFEKSTESLLIIDDHKMDIHLEIKREDATAFAYSSYKDEVYLNFNTSKWIITPFGGYPAGTEVKNWTIDEYCSIHIQNPVFKT